MADVGTVKSTLTAAQRALLEKRLRGKSVTTGQAVVIPRRGGGEDVALSFAQQRLWFMEQMETGRGMYNIPMGLRMKGKLDVEGVEEVLREIEGRHEVLRTTFVL